MLRYSSPILTNAGSTRCPGGLLGSKAKLTPATWGKRPSNLGYMDTPFSSASKMSLPKIGMFKNYLDVVAFYLFFLLIPKTAN